jgi:uncharacterized membrane protein HdeD (DUF308 family)
MSNPGSADTASRAETHPGWGWSIASATLVVGLAAFFFPLAPFWTLLWLAALSLVFGLTPLGAKWVITQRSALLADVTHPALTRHPRLVAVVVFVLPTLLVPGVAWDLSDPGQRWNGGALWAIAVFGFLVRTVVEELRAAGHRARWWKPWLLITIVAGMLVLVGAPARARWAHCEPLLRAAVDAAPSLEQVDVSTDATDRWCWTNADLRVVDGDLRLYTDIDDAADAPANAGEGIVFSPDRSVETAGGVRVLIGLGDGWYWFETGSPVRRFWFDG